MRPRSTAAVLLNYAYGGRYFYYLSGFDPAFARYRLGFVLLSRAIRAAIDEDATEFDFLRGREDYKYRLGATDRAYYDLSMIKPSLRSRASATEAQVEDRVVGWARAFAQRRVRAGAPD